MDLRTPAMPPAPVAAMLPGVTVEALLLGVTGGLLTCRTIDAGLDDDEHPDALARRLAGFSGPDQPPGRLLHSTSWRFAAGRIILTYAALPDPDPRSDLVVRTSLAPAAGSDPLTPSPERIEQADVVAHACRHLAFLRRTDPVVAEAAELHAGLWSVIDRYRPDIAGQRAVRAGPR